MPESIWRHRPLPQLGNKFPPTVAGTTFFVNLAGAVTPTGTESNIKVSLVSTSGAVTPTGSLVKKTNKGLEGGTYKSHILATPSLYNYWRLGDTSSNGSGTIAIAELDRQVPLGNNGAYSAVLNTDYFLGETGALVNDSNTAVRFLAATLGRLDLYFGAFDLNDTNIVAVEVWFKWATSYSNDGCSIWQQFNLDGIEFAITPNEMDGSFSCIGVNNDGLDEAHYTRPSANAYHHMVCVYDKTQTGANRIKLYIDNVLQTQTSGLFTTNTDVFSADTAIVATNPFIASSQVFTLDELALYKGVVSQATVTDHYAAGVQGWWATGALLKNVKKSLSGTITPSGVVTKQLSKAFAGVVTPSGALSRQVNKILSGGITPTGVITKKISKSFTGAITPSGTLLKQVNKLFTGGITPTGTVTFVKLKVLSVTGAVTPTGSLLKQVNKTFTGAITPTGSLLKKVNKSFSGGITPTGTVALLKAVLKSVSGSVTPTGALVKSVNKVLNGNVTPTGTLVKKVNKLLGGTVTPTGIVTKRLSRSFTGNITPTGTVSTSKIPAGGINLSGSVSSSGTVSLIYIAGPPVVPPIITVRRRARHYVEHVISRALRRPLPPPLLRVEDEKTYYRIVTSSVSNLEATGRIVGLTSNVAITSPQGLLFGVIASSASSININQSEEWVLAAKSRMEASGELVVVSNDSELKVKDFDIEAEDLRILFPELRDQ